MISKFIYNLLMGWAEKFKPPTFSVNIESPEQFDSMVEQGFQCNSLEIKINNPPPEFSPLNMTIRELANQAFASNCATLRGQITFTGQENPEVLYWVVLTEELVRKANILMEQFEEENL